MSLNSGRLIRSGIPMAWASLSKVLWEVAESPSQRSSDVLYRLRGAASGKSLPTRSRLMPSMSNMVMWGMQSRNRGSKRLTSTTWPLASRSPEVSR